jgi:hypothetical protein
MMTAWLMAKARAPTAPARHFVDRLRDPLHQTTWSISTE